MLASSSRVKNTCGEDIELPLICVQRVDSVLVAVLQKSENIDIGLPLGHGTQDVCCGIPASRWTYAKTIDECMCCVSTSDSSEASMRWVILLLFVAVCSLFAQSPVPEVGYRSVPDFLQLPPDLYFGEVSGVAVNSKGHIVVFSRCNSTGPAYAASAAQLLEFDASGNFLREIGHNLYAWSYTHTVKVDPHDNIWVTDKGSDMVIKFNPEGRVAMVFARKQEASDEGTGPLKEVKPPLPPVDGQFRQVTDVAWDAAGNTYISDGYINSRIAKIDKEGNWLKSWGEPGDKPGQFDTPHSIAVDAQDNIYVADRGNHRIQVFSRDGTFLRQITIDVAVDPGARPAIGNKTEHPTGSRTPGSPWAICITPPPHQVLYSSDAFPGRIYKLSLDGKVLGTFGKSGKQLGQFGWIHEIACPSENELYVAEILNWRVQKLVLEPSQ